MTHPDPYAALREACDAVRGYQSAETNELVKAARALIAAKGEALEDKVAQALKEARERVAPLIAKERESERIPDGLMEMRLRASGTGGCPHSDKGMCQACTFDWMVAELQRLRADNERLRAAAGAINELLAWVDRYEREERVSGSLYRVQAACRFRAELYRIAERDRLAPPAPSGQAPHAGEQP